MRAIFLVLLLITGCATNKDYAAYLATQQAVAVQQTSQAQAKYAAINKGMEGGSETARMMGMVALMMSQTAPVVVQLPPENEVISLAKSVFPPLAYLGGIAIMANQQNHSATMQRDIAVSSNQMVAGLGNNIQQAGVAGYPFVQAPQPNLTLSGTGVLGSGTYNPSTNTWTNSYNTTRTCNGGAGAGTTTGAPGGPATC